VNEIELMKPRRSVGILGYGSYVPMYRLPNREIAHVWKGGGSGPVKEKSVAGPDEDTVTIAIEAARNALARAVFFNRLGEIRDRSFEQQRYRASGLNLVTAAIVLWNTVYLERAANALRGHGQAVDDGLLQYLSPLGWEHINLTGDYLWRSSAKIGAGKFRPLRPLQPA